MLVKPDYGSDGAVNGWSYDNAEIHEDALYSIIQIDRDRYGGCYSGAAAFTAWPGVRPSDIDAGDIDCQRFWEKNGNALHGAGNSEQEAFHDLQAKIEADYWETDQLRAVFIIDEIGLISSGAVRKSVLLPGSPEFATWLEQG